MSRPAQLEQQIERVKQLQAEMIEDNEPSTPTEPVVGTMPPEPVAPQLVVVEPATISKEEYDRLEQRYRTLQGMHKADVGHLRGELAATGATIQNLEQRIAEAEKASKPQAAPTKYVTAEDEEEYGDTLEMVRRAAREEAEEILAKREEGYLVRIAELETQVGHVRNTVVPVVEDISRSQAEQVKTDFWGAIETQVPNWQAINDNPAFKAWLVAEDQITGSTRQQFLAQAQREYNASRVIKFFKEWERTAAGGQTPAPRNNPQSELEQFVAPGTSRSTPPVDKTKKQWTKEAISKFYQDSVVGKYASKPDERKRIEKDLFDAQSEGRIV